MDLKEIEEILFEIGFDKKPENNNHQDYYEFFHQYPDIYNDNKNPHGSNLWVDFEDYNKIFYVRFNCHNYCDDVNIKDIKDKEDFLYHLDIVVLNGKNAWIYSDPTFNCYGPAATEQRKRYFDIRMKMDSKPTQDIIDFIEKEGLDPVKTILDTKYNEKRIGDMNWEELANALHNELNNKNDG